jgi:hypothetical protein
MKSIEHTTYLNLAAPLSSQTRNHMANRWAQCKLRQDQISTLNSLKQQSHAALRLTEKIHQKNLLATGLSAADLAEMRNLDDKRMSQIMHHLATIDTAYHAPQGLSALHTLDGKPDGVAEFWWGQTNWKTNDLRISSYWDEQAGLRFTGSLNPEDVFTRRHFTALAQFDLSADRIPSSLLGAVVSAPKINILGAVRGVTNHGFLDFGNQWCKCWLNLRQSVWAYGSGINKTSRVIASNQSVLPLILIDGDDFVDTYLPGTINMPAVQFNIYNGWNLQVELELWFDIQLLGDNTLFSLGQTALFPTNLIQTPQWLLQKA